MEKENRDHWAGVLNQARLHGRPIEQLSRHVQMNRSDAYEIQEQQWAQRCQAGEQLLGWKMGLTSEAKRKQMNLDSPLYGFLSNRMQVDNGSVFLNQGLIHPKIEPEIAFLIGRDLNSVPTRQEAYESIEAVAAALEILDSRYQEFRYFSMEDVIADNSSSSHFVVGPWVRDFSVLDLSSLTLEMTVNGQAAQKGISRDISGDPVLSLVQLCELLKARNQVLKKGSLVLAGAATQAEALRDQMKVELFVQSLPPVSVFIQNGKV